MIPPLSYEHSTYFKGFEHPNDPTIIIMTAEVPSSYTEVAEGLKKESLLLQGMNLKYKTNGHLY